MDESKKKDRYEDAKKFVRYFRWCKDVQYGNDKISRSG